MRRYGYQGFYDKTEKPVVLTRKNVDGIQLTGGTILGTSRGGADIKCAAAPWYLVQLLMPLSCIDGP